MPKKQENPRFGATIFRQILRGVHSKMRLITLHLTEAQIKALDKLVPRFYPNRAEAIRLAVRDLINNEKHLAQK